MAATYSLEDIQAHKTRKSLWLTIQHKVYDVTSFIDEVGRPAWGEDWRLWLARWTRTGVCGWQVGRV